MFINDLIYWLFDLINSSTKNRFICFDNCTIDKIYWEHNEYNKCPIYQIKMLNFLSFSHFWQLAGPFLIQTMTNSQIIRKLKPKKRPRTPPTSARRDPNGKAASSFSMTTLLEAFTIVKVVVFPTGTDIGVSGNWNQRLIFIHLAGCP